MAKSSFEVDRMLTGFSILQGCRYISLTTFHKDGQPAAIPLRFAQDGDKVYVLSPADVAQRIHDNAQVEVAPCTEDGGLLGGSTEAMAVVISGDHVNDARRALTRKYGFEQRLNDLLLMLRQTTPIYLEITPM
jgi:PPOX class probable F420-dependent enzyme